MDNLLNIVLEAHNVERNHHRQYEITLGKDLLDDWTVKIRFGRAGQYGRVQQFASRDIKEMRSVICDRLRRRLSAPKRIGCEYQWSGFSESHGIDAAHWLPRQLLGTMHKL